MTKHGKPQKRWSIFTPGKTVYTECFSEYSLSDNEIRKLQNCLLGMFLDIRQLCEENGIRYMMAGGSLLGTIRHQGFIPWDDDIDVMMTRKEYGKFRKAFRAAGKEGRMSGYILADPLRSEGYYFKSPKIYKKDTEYCQINYMGNPRYNMVSIDIFILEYIPENPLRRRVNALVFDFAFYASSVCLDDLYPSPVILRKCRENQALRRFFCFRKTMGAVFSHLGGIRFYLRLCGKIAAYPGKTSKMGLPCARSYTREVFDVSVFDAVKAGSFCGYAVNIPRGYDAYLRNVYGDYRKLPPENEREIHVAYKVRV